MKLFPAIAALILAIGAFYLGCNCGKSCEEVKAFMQTETYKAQERAFLAR